MAPGTSDGELAAFGSGPLVRALGDAFAVGVGQRPGAVEACIEDALGDIGGKNAAGEEVVALHLVSHGTGESVGEDVDVGIDAGRSVWHGAKVYWR